MWNTHSATYKGVKSVSLKRAHNLLMIGNPRTQALTELEKNQLGSCKYTRWSIKVKIEFQFLHELLTGNNQRYTIQNVA